MQSLPKRCARAARGRDCRAAMLRPHAGSTVLACSRRASRAPALTLCRTRSNEGCSPLSVRPTELELRRSHPVQQVHRAFRCLHRLKVICHAQRDSNYDTSIQYVYHYLYTTSCQPSATAADRGRPAVILILLLLRSNQPTSRDPVLVSLRTLMGRGERLRSYWNSHMSNAPPAQRGKKSTCSTVGRPAGVL